MVSTQPGSVKAFKDLVTYGESQHISVTFLRDA